MMVYVAFPDFYRDSSVKSVHLLFNDIVDWLNENCGAQYECWNWLIGDLHAQGVYVPTREDAVAFRLRFKL